MPGFRPLSATDTDVSMEPETVDGVALTVVDPLRLAAVPYSNETVVEVPFAFADPPRVAVVVPIDVAGVTVVAEGGVPNVKPPVLVAEPPIGVVRTTSTAPAAWAGVTTVIDVALELTIGVPAVPPNVTPLVPVKLVPVIVTVVPPPVVPVAGDIPVIVGAPT